MIQLPITLNKEELAILKTMGDTAYLAVKGKTLRGRKFVSTTIVNGKLVTLKDEFNTQDIRSLMDKKLLKKVNKNQLPENILEHISQEVTLYMPTSIPRFKFEEMTPFTEEVDGDTFKIVIAYDRKYIYNNLTGNNLAVERRTTGVLNKFLTVRMFQKGFYYAYFIIEYKGKYYSLEKSRVEEVKPNFVKQLLDQKKLLDNPNPTAVAPKEPQSVDMMEVSEESKVGNKASTTNIQREFGENFYSEKVSTFTLPIGAEADEQFYKIGTFLNRNAKSSKIEDIESSVITDALFSWYGDAIVDINILPNEERQFDNRILKEFVKRDSVQDGSFLPIIITRRNTWNENGPVPKPVEFYINFINDTKPSRIGCSYNLKSRAVDRHITMVDLSLLISAGEVSKILTEEGIHSLDVYKAIGRSIRGWNYFKKSFKYVPANIDVDGMARILLDYFIEEKVVVETLSESKKENTVATSYITKKNIPDQTLEVMKDNAFLGNNFNYVEIDESVDLELFREIEEDYKAIKDTLPPLPTPSKVRFRKLGKHRASGIYFSGHDSIGIDVRTTGSFVHEYGHALDYKLGAERGELMLSTSKEFLKIVVKYVRGLNGKGVPPNDFKYYTKNTEVFARGFELYMLNRIDSALLTPEVDKAAYRPFLENNGALLKEVSEFLDNNL